MDVFSSRISLLRQKRGWSQEDVAKGTGISQKQISRYERGMSEPTAEALSRLAQIFDVTTDWLLGLTDNESRPLRNLGDLSDDEKRILELYRRVPSDRRELLNGVIKAFNEKVGA